MTEKPAPTPKWWKNTFFWIALILFVVGVLGLPMLGGDRLIRDPGQEPETHLWAIYFGAALVMVVNGLLSHGQTVRAFRESQEVES